jgi:tetratricopeptide (TPR) repeat protein
VDATKLEKAKGLCEDALKIKDFNKEVSLHFNYAQVLWRYGQMDDAGKQLLEGLRWKPRHLESLYLLGLIRYQQRRLPEAKKLWKQVAGLGGRKNPLSRQAVRCLQVLEQQELRAAELAAKRKTAAKPDSGGLTELR